MNLKQIKQGSIIKIDPNPVKGSEQGKYRPHMVISNDIYNSLSALRILVPISNRGGFVLDKELTGTITKGYAKCQHIKTLDLSARNYLYVEEVNNTLLQEIKKLATENID